MIHTPLLSWLIFDLDELAGHFKVALCHDDVWRRSMHSSGCLHIQADLPDGHLIYNTHLPQIRVLYITAQYKVSKGCTTFLSFIVPLNSTTPPDSDGSVLSSLILVCSVQAP